MEDDCIPKIALYKELSTVHRENLKCTTETVSKSPSLYVMLTTYAGHTLQWTMVLVSTRFSRQLTSFEKTEETCKWRRYDKQKESSSHLRHWTLLSLVDIAYGPAFPT